MIEIKIKGAPIPKARPRARIIAPKGRKPFVSVYDGQKKETEAVKLLIKEQFNLRPVLTPLKLIVDFNMQRPKSHYGTGRNMAVVKPSAPKFHAKKPDIDNLVKFYMDAMNGIVYKDDSQVVEINACKNYTSYEGSTIITINEIKLD